MESHTASMEIGTDEVADKSTSPPSFQATVSVPLSSSPSHDTLDQEEQEGGTMRKNEEEAKTSTSTAISDKPRVDDDDGNLPEKNSTDVRSTNLEDDGHWSSSSSAEVVDDLLSNLIERLENANIEGHCRLGDGDHEHAQSKTMNISSDGLPASSSSTSSFSSSSSQLRVQLEEEREIAAPAPENKDALDGPVDYGEGKCSSENTIPSHGADGTTDDSATSKGDFLPSHEILREIGSALSTMIGKEMEGYMECESLIKTLSRYAKVVGEEVISANDFWRFLSSNHDHVLRHDPTVRAFTYRIIRRLITSARHRSLGLSEQYCTLLASCDYHLMVVVDFELFMNESLIRTEAVKIMKAFMEIAPMAFPLEFASSLVSVAQQGRYLSMNGVVEADEFRFVALEILTSLAYTNYPVVAQVNGFKILVEAILDPGGHNGLKMKKEGSTKKKDINDSLVYRSIAESILMVILYLLDDPKSRAYIHPYVDIKNILAPFFELDMADEQGCTQRRKHAKDAIVCMLRSWTGIILLTSDVDCLPRLVTLIESKISESVKLDIVDCIAELFEPLLSKITPSAKRLRNNHELYHNKPSKNSRPDERSKYGVASGSFDEHSGKKNDGISGGGKKQKGGVSGINFKSLFHQSKSSSSSSTMSVSSSCPAVDGSRLLTNPSEDPGSQQTRSRAKSISTAMMNVAKSALPSKLRSKDDAEAISTRNKERSSFSIGLKSLLKGGKDKGKDNNEKEKTLVVTPQKHSPPVAIGMETRQIKYDRRSSVPPSDFFSGDYKKEFLDDTSPAKALFPFDDPKEAANHEIEMMMNAYSPGEDVVYNMTDSYAAILSNAFLHCKLLECLCEVGTHATGILSKKSRELLVVLLRVASSVYSESVCNDLLALPQLIKYSTSMGTKSFPDLAYKATDILNALADAFSTATHLDWRNDTRYKSTDDDLDNDDADKKKKKKSLKDISSREAARDTSGLYIPSFIGTRAVKSSLVANGRTIIQVANDVREYNFDSSHSSLLDDVPMQIYTSIITEMDNSHFFKLMESTRVSSMKDEPLKWDWLVIEELLESGFPKDNPERVSEALKNKLLKRIFGFFRCNQADTSLFPNLYWEPGNLLYLENMCLLHEVLLSNNVLVVPSQKDQKKKNIPGVSAKSQNESIVDDVLQEITKLLSNCIQHSKMSTTSASSASFFKNPSMLSSSTFGGRNFYKRESKIEKDTKDRQKVLQEESRNSRHNLSVLSSIDLSSHGNNNSGSNVGDDHEQRGGSGSDSGASSTSNRNMLQRRACVQRMIREYFLFVGRVTVEYAEKIGSNRFRERLLQTGYHPSLDYLSRLAVTSLSFTDNGYISGEVIKEWSLSNDISESLKRYLHCLQRQLLLCRSESFLRWGLDVLISHAKGDDAANTDIQIIKTLQEAALNKTYLSVLIAKRPAILNLSALVQCSKESCTLEAFLSKEQNQQKGKIGLEVDNLLCRFASTEEGIDYLDEHHWLLPAVQSWKYNGSAGRKYVQDAEGALAAALCEYKSKGVDLRKVNPIPVDAKDICESAHKGVDMEGLLRLPWNIEVKVTKFDTSQQSSSLAGVKGEPSNTLSDNNGTASTAKPSASSATSLGGVFSFTKTKDKASNTFASLSSRFSSSSPSNSLDAQRSSKLANFAALTNVEEYLHLDSFLDNSEPNLLGCTSSSSIRIVKVRGIVLSKHTGVPLSKAYTNVDGSIKVNAGGHPVMMDKLLSACMQIGVCPVHRVGRIYPESNIPGIMLGKKSGDNDKSKDDKTQVDRSDSSSTKISSASSISAGASYDTEDGQVGLRASIEGTGAYAEFLRSDFPACALSEELQDWSYCSPKDRQNQIYEELGGGRFSVAIPGDPCVWIFNRMSEAQGMMVESNQKYTAPTRSNIVYLAEIHYYLKLDTGQPLFMPMPRHLYGELSRSHKGCSILTSGNEYGEGNIVGSLVSFLKKEKRRLFLPTRKNSAIGGAPGSGSNKQSMALSLSTSIPGEFPVIAHISRSNVLHKLDSTSAIHRTPSVDSNNSLNNKSSPDGTVHSKTSPLESPSPSMNQQQQQLAGSSTVGQQTTVNIFNPKEARQSTLDYRAALWAIGHIGSTELGMALIRKKDPDFVMWCIDQARFSPIFSIRGTCFMVLGLMSRTEKGLHALYEANWHCASHRNVAVAIPREEGDLFEPMCGHGIYGHMISHATHVTKCTLKVSTDAYQGSGAKEREAERPFLRESMEEFYMRIGLVTDDVVEQDELANELCKGNEKCTCPTCILSMQRNIVEHMVALPSVLGCREATMKLAEIYRSHPGVFRSRKLYLAVHKLFVMFTFPLRARRQIFNWFFSQHAQMMDPPAAPIGSNNQTFDASASGSVLTGRALRS